MTTGAENVPSDRHRVIAALAYATSDDGAHHKQWAIDQMVRALTGCPMVERTALDADEDAQAHSEIEHEAYR